MARRSKDNAVDWDAIERQYRLGQRTNAQLADEFGVSGSSIGRRAKSHGWVVDKADEVAAVAASLLIQNASGNANPNATPSALEIKAAGHAAADVVLGHRKGLRKLTALRDVMLDELAASSTQEGQDALESLLQAAYGDDADDTSARRRLDKALSLSGRIDDLKRLAEIDERIRKGEREAFGLDAKGATPEGASVTARIGIEFVSAPRRAEDDDE